MKFIVIFLFAAGLQVNATGYSQTISLAQNNVSLKKVFREIGKQSGYQFFYKDKLIREARNVSVNVRNATVESVLNECFKNQPLSYTVLDKIIVIKAKKYIELINPVPILPAPLSIIRGTVKDEKGKPLAGVSVVIKGTRTGTSTDTDGIFSIDANVGEVLEFTIVGYQKRSVIIKNNETINIQMQIEATSGSEIVVVGYGTKKREYLTGSVSTVNSEVLQSRPITNTMSALQGEIPGVIIQRSSGQPGAEGFDLNVRGYSSTNGGNTPLVLIDGVAGNLDLLNPDDIESISILKDGAASIYGARAANGVMIVTTKTGRKGSPKISYSGNVAVSKMSGMMKSPSNYQFALMENEANIHNGAAPMYTPELLDKIKNNDPNPIPHPIYGGWMLFFTNTNWIDAVIGNGFQQKHNINISGGGNNSVYYLSGGYSKEDGVIKYAPDNNERYNLRLNYDYDFSKSIRLETKVSFDNQNRTDVGGVGSQGIITEAIFGMPNHPVYTQDDKNFFAQGGWGNAVAEAKEGATASFKTHNINMNFKLIFDVFKDLKFNLQAGINQTTQDNNDIGKAVPLYLWDNSNIQYYAIANPDQAWLTRTSYNGIYQNFTGYLEYKKKFDEHEIVLMAGGSYEYNNFDWFNTTRDHFSTDNVWSINLGGTQNMSSTEQAQHWAIASVFSRLSYTYNNKYLLDATLRYDGSSRFQPNSRWGVFPGVSVAWRIGQENFMKNIGIFSDLKLRGSYGQTGNQEGIGLYDYIQLINIGGSYPFGAGTQTQSASLAGMVSTNRTWETLINKNVGIDGSLLSNKFNFSFDYFIKRNKNLLIPVTYPSVLGAIPPYSNSGELKTWGFETSVGWRDQVGNFKYSVKLILSDAQNKVVKYGGSDTYILGLNSLNEWPYPSPRQGYPLDSYYGYVFDGVIRTQKELDDYKKLGGVPSDIKIGDAMFKDLNGDGKISLYGDKPGENGDVEYLGMLTPRFNFGININLSYKNFDLGIFAQGVG
ncbi:MAG: TonB-dependent receptor, partial [Ginsengibacter sp.]